MVNKTQRRLAAILAADVAGYTQLVELDTDGTVAAWKSARDDVIKPLVDKKSGHIIKFTGDGFLVEFPSVQDAVACAIALQEELQPSSLNFRIGINVGDITDDGDDVHGEGVNIAARLEALAEPGGICISGDVYNLVRNRIGAVFKDMGEQEVKHVSRPVSVFAINPTNQKTSDHLIAPTPALPATPSIAVLPFVNMSGDPEQEYFSDGITEDIITALSRISGLLVIARNSTMVYKDKTVDVKKVALEQGVQNVLEGSVRKSGNRIRVTAQLIDATTGHHQWAERYDREIDDVFTVQDDITHQITVAMQVEISVGEKAQMLACRTSNVHAWERLIRADDLNRNFARADNIKACTLLEEAVVLDPDFVSAWVELGWVHWADVYYGWSASSEQSAKLANEAATKALALEPEYPNTYSLLGFMAVITKDFERGIELCEKGASLAPNNAENVAELASVLILAGQVEEAEQCIRRAIRLSPICPPYYHIIVGLCHLVKSDLESAVSTLRIAVEQLPDSIWPKVYLISALVESSHLEEARKLAQEVQSMKRDFSIEAWHATRFKDPEFMSRTHENLRKAGLSG